MKVWRIGKVLAILALGWQANASGQQDAVGASVRVDSNARESVAIQAIRNRLAESCIRNRECVQPAGSGDSDRRLEPSQALRGRFPSTPERRRDLGLTASSPDPEMRRSADGGGQ